MKRLFILYCILISAFSSFAQSKDWVKLMKKEATFYFKNEDYYNALGFYNRIIAANPKDDDAHVLSVISKFHLSYPVDSFTVHEARLAKSSNADAKYCLARIRHQQKRFLVRRNEKFLVFLVGQQTRRKYK